MSAHSQIDRKQPCIPPQRKPSGFQQWNSLAFLHWEVPVDAVCRLLPEGLEPDLYEGKAYAGLVPFQMRHIRPHWCPKCFGFNFLETNVRTYVICDGEPGVYFFSLDANSFTAVTAARWGWHLPYYHSQMTFSRREDQITYTLDRAGQTRSKIEIYVGDEKPPSPENSLDFFLLERYLLFTRNRHTLLRGQVHHRPYPVRGVKLRSCDDELVAHAGFASLPGTPATVHFSEGVEVKVFSLTPVHPRSSC
ncbi:MAG: DUF2071 domain-containing protein [Planctomycetota bacterium]|nr:DUF2071 domain-containing protein [Planctomycetota bacterium]